MARGKIDIWNTPEGLAQLEAWTEEKLTDVDIAAKIGISRSTLALWKKKNPAIADALDFSEEKANRKKYLRWMTPDGMLLIRAWARNGLTDEELASKLDIARSTLAVWKKKFPLFAELLSRTKEIIDIEVENAAFKAATGYEFVERMPMKVKTTWYDPDTGKKCLETEEVIVVDVPKNQPPDTKAIIFWLKNRQGQTWKERQVIEVNGVSKDGVKFTFETLPDNVEKDDEIMG